MPAAHTVSSAGIFLPLAVETPCASTPVTFSPVSTCTRSPRSSFAAPFDRRSGSAGRMRGAASMMVSFTSFSGSMRSSPYATSSRVVLCSSAASSTPVAPAPMMATFNWCASSGAACALARMQALMRRRWKVSA